MTARRALALVGLCGWLLAPFTVRAQDVEVGDYRLVSSRRVTRTLYEDVYKANASNWGGTDASVSANLTSIVPQITVVEGGLSFGDVAAGATQVSTDTFTVRHDRSKPFDVDGLVWTPTVTPLAPTSFALIDQALASGVISDETALLYRVYEEFNDERLPLAFQGRDQGDAEASFTMEASHRFASLSANTQLLIAPFLLAPNEPGSWYEARIAQNAAANAQSVSVKARSTKVVAARNRLAAVAASAPAFSSADTTHLRVWWDALNHPEHQARAGEIALEVERVWTKLTGLLGVPMSDGVRFGDGRLDILIVDRSVILRRTRIKEAEAVDLDFPGPCTAPAPSFIMITTASPFPTVIHEVTHAILKGYELKTGCNFPEYFWMDEATATWAEHYIYPTKNTEHGQAVSFLKAPSVELESMADAHHPYGAYLWFLYATRGVDGGAHYVRETWNAAATLDSLAAVDKGIAGLGGLAEAWPQFALYNWNRKAGFSFDLAGSSEVGMPYRYYAKWDKLEHKAAEVSKQPVKLRLNGKTFVKYPLSFNIPHLAASYFHYDFRDDHSIRSVTLNQPYAGGTNSRARVEVIAKIRGQEWKPAQDWTSFAAKKLCLDRPEEDVEELVVVVTNSEFTARGSNVAMKTPQDGPMDLEISAVGCSPWIGTIEYTRNVDRTGSEENGFDGREIRESASTNAMFELAPVSGINNNVYVPTSVVSTWHHTGKITSRDQSCSGTRNAVTTPGPTDTGELITLQFPPPLGDGSTLYYQGLGHIDPRFRDMNIAYTCSDGSMLDTTFGDGATLTWWATRPLVFDPGENEAAILENGDLVMRGDFHAEEGDASTMLTVETWHWELKQVKRK